MTPTLPPLCTHDHPEPHTMRWSEQEMSAIRAYALKAIAAHIEAIRPEVLRLADEMVSLNAVAAIFHSRCQWDKRDLAARERDAARAALAALLGGAG